MTDLEHEARLERLERQNRWLKRAGIVALVLVGSTLLVGFTAQRTPQPAGVPDLLEAQRFVLKNAKGQMRADLALLADEPALRLYDAQGRERLRLAGWGDMPGLALYDAHGESRAVLGVRGDGSVLVLSDARGKERAALAVVGGAPGLWLYDAQGKDRAALGVPGDAPSLWLTDGAGFRAVLGTVEVGTIETGESRRTSAASLVLFDKEGKVIWGAP